MTRLRVFLARLASLVADGGNEEELRQEIETHLAMLADEFRQRGLSDEQARAAARSAFGPVERVRDEHRDQRRLPSVDSMLQDVRYAARLLLKDRSITLAALALLTIGIGSTVVMADMLDRLLIRPPASIANPDRVKRIYTAGEDATLGLLVTNYPTIDHLAHGLASDVPFVAAYFNESIGFGRGREARRLHAVTHTSAYFDVLRLNPALGVLPSSLRTSTPDTVVISYQLWQHQFAGAADVIGRTLPLGSRIYTIVAVTPRAFTSIDLDPVDIWLPIESRAADSWIGAEWRTGTSYMGLRVILRLRPGVEPTLVEARATTVYNAGPLPLTMDGKPRRYRVLLGELPPARKPGGTQESVIIVWLAGVSAAVLLIACGNVGSLLLVRGLRRGRELAMKTALGATRARLLREILCEAFLLSLIAGGTALLVALAGGTTVHRVLLPSMSNVPMPLDWRLAVLAAAVSMVAALVLGLLPAVRLTTHQRLNPGRVLNEAGGSPLLGLYSGLQVALSLPLVMGASLFVASFVDARHARETNMGMHPTNIVVVSSDFVEAGEAARAHAGHRLIEERLHGLPSVQSVALVQTVPLMEGFSVPYSVPGTEPTDSVEGPYVNAVDASFFTLMGMHFSQGQGFTPAENVAGGRPVVVVNETMARLFWPHQSAVGRCVQVGSGKDAACAEVVGVVANSAMWASLDFAVDPPPMYFVPIEQYRTLTNSRALLVKTTGPADDLIPSIRAAAQQVGANLPYVDVWSFDDALDPTLRPLRLAASIFVVFGVLALVLAGIGLSTLTAYRVACRTREFGIRVALGAQPAGLVTMVLGRVVILVLLGLAAGTALSYAGGKWLASVLYGVEPTDPLIFAGCAGGLLLAGTLAAYLPARRAGNVSPVEALRWE